MRIISNTRVSYVSIDLSREAEIIGGGVKSGLIDGRTKKGALFSVDMLSTAADRMVAVQELLPSKLSWCYSLLFINMRTGVLQIWSFATAT